jgi:PAS domain S-box-containing protein
MISQARSASSLRLASALVLGALTLAAAMYALGELIAANAWVKRSDEVRIALDRLSDAVMQAEANHRGYILSGDPSFRDAVTQACNAVPLRVAEVRRLTIDDPEQQARADEVSRLAQAHLALFELPPADRPLVEAAPSLLAGFLVRHERMRRLQGAIDRMMQAELRIDSERERDQLLRGRALVIVLVAGTFLFGALSVGALNRRREEARFEVQRQLFNSVLEALDEGITVQSPTGEVVFANHSAARMVGFASPEQFMSAPQEEVRRRFEVFAEDGAPFAAEKLPGHAVLQGRPGDEVLVRYRSPGKAEPQWLTVRAAPLRDPAGRIVHAVNLFRDVSERRREEEQRAFLLRAVEQFDGSLDFESTLASVAHQVVPSLADWCTVDLAEDDRLKRLVVAHVDPRKVALIEDLQRRYPEEPAVPGSPQETLRSGKPFLLSSITPEMLRRGARDAEQLALIQSLELCSWLAVPMVAGTRRVGVLTLAMAESGRHYTERDTLFATAFAERAATAIEHARLYRATAAALDREMAARQEAERTARFSEMFIGVLGHDLRNPLSAVGTSAQLLLRVANDERQRKPALRIVSSVERMARMIDQLLDFTRIRIGRGLELSPRSVNLGELGQQIAEETEEAHGRPIKTECLGDLSGRWDGDRLAQVLANLLTNAARHGTPEKAISLRLDGRAAEAVTLAVSNGGQIPPELLPSIFEPFKSGNIRPSTGGGNSLGLGLYITHAIVEAHGGTIDVASTEQEGTAFQIRLPRQSGA